MSPHVSDDELSVAGGVELPAVVDAPAPKQLRSMACPGPQGKRCAPEPVEPIPSIFRDDDRKLLSDMRTRSREQHMSLSPPTSSGQMSPTSVCTATAYAYSQAGTSWSQPSGAACQRADTATVQSPVRTTANQAPPPSYTTVQEAKASSFPQHEKTATAPKPTMIMPATKEGRPALSCDAMGHVPSGCEAIPTIDTKSHAQATSSRSKRPRVRNRATAVCTLLHKHLIFGIRFVPSDASSACTYCSWHTSTVFSWQVVDTCHDSAYIHDAECAFYVCSASKPIHPSAVAGNAPVVGCAILPFGSSRWHMPVANMPYCPMTCAQSFRGCFFVVVCPLGPPSCNCPPWGAHTWHLDTPE